jgi:hypothetical protein
MTAGSALIIGNNTAAVQNKLQYCATCEHSVLHYLIVRPHRWSMFENRVLRRISNHG